jgi:hypothetical protein
VAGAQAQTHAALNGVGMCSQRPPAPTTTSNAREAVRSSSGSARPGVLPLGVVRSGSLVVIRPRAVCVVRPGALSAEQLLDKVA